MLIGDVMFIDAECNGFSSIFSIIVDISDNFPGYDNIIPTFGKSCLIVFFFCGYECIYLSEKQKFCKSQNKPK